ncbi:unnamed protein product [Vitrella brassicaformis CCMP3155]|uniref:Nicotinate phosphoribosyltransferase n=3 Tax=Vitrella brassicaformis TaxID=1169539 RepID=A0A0G4EP85_VITBC|nr:unnamed protein product [Vitrella brassicaformis CCMP3155]|eukprot:CEL99239.1 unnamed protein product [Vitrella brassicaformis CCMP3155]
MAQQSRGVEVDEYGSPRSPLNSCGTTWERRMSAQLVWRDRNEIPQLDPSVGLPHSEAVESTLTDFYQITMCYAYWKAGKENQHAVFDLFFRKCPFHGEFAIIAGVEEAVRFLNTFHFSNDQIEYLKGQLPTAKEGFFDFLKKLDCSKVTVYAIPEGSIVFAKEPLMRIEGPLAVCQLLETPLLNLLNYASLVATNAARHAMASAANPGNRPIQLLEFGTRRAQGPDGAMSASRYSYLGGFHGTSNVRAGHLFGIPVVGTHAHAFVTSFEGLRDLEGEPKPLGTCEDFVQLVLQYRAEFNRKVATKPTMQNEGELAAFISYALSFPKNCLALVDTYDTIHSGVCNFLMVALALHSLGYKARGIRLDSGDLAYLSKEARKLFKATSKAFDVPFDSLAIVASNDINEKVIMALNQEGHELDSFGIGTHLVTCQAQPALGMVYKLAELDSTPRMKLSQDVEKTSIPCRKALYRLYARSGVAVLDMMQHSADPPPKEGDRIFCRHLFDETKRCYVVPSRVEQLLVCIWQEGKSVGHRPSLKECRDHCIQSLKMVRSDHLRTENPTPYKVSASGVFYDFFKDLWQKTSPIFELQ